MCPMKLSNITHPHMWLDALSEQLLILDAITAVKALNIIQNVVGPNYKRTSYDFSSDHFKLDHTSIVSSLVNYKSDLTTS